MGILKRSAKSCGKLKNVYNKSWMVILKCANCNLEP